ncbi:hypothetical protein B1H29_10980 [Streptomyces pactum]|uniref:WD40 domain-containing protein n=1 Tax=Streptomyces pactum TaxID=68249 RepID=A0A1S6J6M9_9ACTN|nr:hypothetical protein B1H29_10980 [Streptomyces pactum]
MVLAAATVATAAPSASAASKRGDTVRISVSADGREVAYGGRSPSLSADGRFAVFESSSPGLVPEDTDQKTDVFLRDLRRGTIERISVRDDGGAYEHSSFAARISPDGRYVTYTAGTGSYADGTYFSGVYLHDRVKHRTELVSLTDDERAVPQPYGTAQVSRGGRYVAFLAEFRDTGDTGDGVRNGLYLRDRRLGTTRLISRATPPTAGGSEWTVGYHFTMSADAGRLAYGLERGRAGYVVHVHDRRTGRTEAFDEAAGTRRPPTFSGDGRHMAFVSFEADLVPGDTNATSDVFVRDLRTGTTERVSLAADGGQLDDRSGPPVISEDGRRVVFSSAGTGLVPGGTEKTQLYVRDLRTDVNRQVTVALHPDDVGYGVYAWQEAAPSRDGRTVAFETHAGNLVPGDTNRSSDVFVRRMR